MTVYYPDGLPRGLHSGRKYQLQNPLMRSDLVSGRARQRRRFTSVPEGVGVTWLFTEIQGRAFEAWWRDALVDGALWFECPLDHPLGYDFYTCRFTGAYEGPMRVGPDLWNYSAELELRERIAMPVGWGAFPDFIINAAILDYAMNREWPKAINYTLATQLGEELVTQDNFNLITG